MVDKENTIYFYDFESELARKEHIFLNNFDVSKFVDPTDNLDYLTVEHYYQCHKFDNFEKHPEFKEAFETISEYLKNRTAENADICKKAARSNEAKFEGVWEKERWHSSYKDYIMRRGLMLKFSQNVDLLKRLLETGKKRLVEESYKDPYWGGMLPDSKNKLGDFLVELRENYRKMCKVYLSDCGFEPLEVSL